MLVVVEGVDGSGKTTQVREVAKTLEAVGHKVATFAFPDRTTQIGHRINLALKSAVVNEIELYHLFVANRFEKLDALRMALASHDFVIVDRYSYSGIAYTRANGHQVNIEDALAADVAAVLPPHMIFYLPPVAVPVVKEIYDELRVEVSIEYERIWSVAGAQLPLVRVPRAGIKATTDFIIEHLLGQKKE